MRAVTSPNYVGGVGVFAAISLQAQQTRRCCHGVNGRHRQDVRLEMKCIPKGWNRDLDAKSAVPFVFCFFLLFFFFLN